MSYALIFTKSSQRHAHAQAQRAGGGWEEVDMPELVGAFFEVAFVQQVVDGQLPCGLLALHLGVVLQAGIKARPSGDC